MSLPPDIVLICGPLVGASSWARTADRLRASGNVVCVPDVVTAAGGPPPWRLWTSHLAALIPSGGRPLLVAHSAASPLAADLATRMPVSGLIIVDGDIPPESGPAAPMRKSVADWIAGFADDQGRLPPWPRWWRDDARLARLTGVEELARDPQALETLEADAPRMTVEWFDDVIDLAPWAHVPAGYVQISPIYDRAGAEAERRGWPMRRIAGSHLHLVLQPDETAEAIQTVRRELVQRA